MSHSLDWFGLVSLFNSISSFLGYFDIKIHTFKRSVVVLFSWKDVGVHTFDKGIRAKVNVIARLEFELAYNNVTVQHVSHCVRGYPLCEQLLRVK